MTHARLSASVERLRDQVVTDAMKGVPLGTSIRLGDIGDQGWNLLRGDLAFPVTTLSAAAVETNLAAMQAYCDRSRARFAPHGKTTMSPQLFARQFEHGAWALTAGTPTQAAVMRRHGVPRIIVANQISDASALAWVASQLDEDEDFELFCLVDSVELVERMTDVLERVDIRRPVPVLLEVGVEGGRCGVRDAESALAVATATHRSPRLALAGVEGYEGLVTGGGGPDDIAALDRYFERMRRVTERLLDERLFDVEDVIVTAGGSSYFDRVVAGLSDVSSSGRSATLVLRSGCYVSHDADTYERLSPLAERAPEGEELRLVEALTVWGSVLSRPEPDLLIVGVGKRDAAFDVVNPLPRTLHRRDGTTEDLRGCEVFRLMDQHAFLRIPPELRVGMGDVVAFGVSHPCTAFDKARLIPLVDDETTVVDAILTFF